MDVGVFLVTFWLTFWILEMDSLDMDVVYYQSSTVGYLENGIWKWLSYWLFKNDFK